MCEYTQGWSVTDLRLNSRTREPSPIQSLDLPGRVLNLDLSVLIHNRLHNNRQIQETLDHLEYELCSRKTLVFSNTVRDILSQCRGKKGTQIPLCAFLLFRFTALFCHAI